MRISTCLVAFLMTALLTPAVLHADEHEKEFLKGEVKRDRFALAVGEMIVATEDLTIVSAEEAIIEGLIVANPGVSIEIVASEILVKGRILAGHGAHGRDVLEHGQHGGNITFRAPSVHFEQAKVRAGWGGHAGPAGNGGNGGSIIFVNVEQLTGDEQNRLEGGRAGQAGAGINGFGDRARRGGNGGDGGGMKRIDERTKRSNDGPDSE